MTTNPSSGLAALEQGLTRDLAYLNFPPADWIPRIDGPDGKRVLDVLVVGGGTCGMTAAFALRRLGISNIRMVDMAEKGLEGPWLTFARMETLRSPKHLTGPALGLPNLTFRAWFEAQFGAEAWQELGRIPRVQWAEYLAWFGRVTSANIENHVTLLDVAPSGEFLEAQLHDLRHQCKETVYVRRLVLATGRDALSTPRIPAPLAPHLGVQVYHTSDAPPQSVLGGRDVVVVGLAASAFDYAAEALEAGAKRVTMLGRSTTIPRINKAKQVVYPGFTLGLPEAADQDRYATFREIVSCGVPPPRDSALRVTRNDKFEIRLGTEITDARLHAERLELTTTSGRLHADVLILGTGFHVDISGAPFLAGMAPSIKTWRDAVPDARQDDELLDFPYLGGGFEFQSRSGQPDSSLVDHLYCFNHAAMVSLGNLANDIPAVSDGAERLSRAIAQAFFKEDRAQHRAALTAYDEPELLGDEIPKLAR